MWRIKIFIILRKRNLAETVINCESLRWVHPWYVWSTDWCSVELSCVVSNLVRWLPILLDSYSYPCISLSTWVGADDSLLIRPCGKSDGISFSRLTCKKLWHYLGVCLSPLLSRTAPPPFFSFSHSLVPSLPISQLCSDEACCLAENRPIMRFMWQGPDHGFWLTAKKELLFSIQQPQGKWILWKTQE